MSYVLSIVFSPSPVTLDAISSEGPVGLEEDGVLHARVVHRTAFQARIFGDSGRRLRGLGEYSDIIRRVITDNFLRGKIFGFF